MPALFVLFVVLGGVVSFFLPIVRLPYFGVLGFYLAAIFFFAGQAAIQERKPALLLLMPLVFATIHCGAGFGLLQECIFGSSADGRLVR